MRDQDKSVAIIGCGFVADLYMRSLQTFPDIRVTGVWDHDATRLAAFCAHWGLSAAPDQAALLDMLPKDGVVLNLTNPGAHFEVNSASLNAGHHVYCEKPLAMTVAEAKTLTELAAAKGLQLASAPCSVLGEAAQTLGQAIRNGTAGTPRATYWKRLSVRRRCSRVK
mgnify:FL=1